MSHACHDGSHLLNKCSEIVSDYFYTDNLLDLSAFNSDWDQFAAQRSALLGFRHDRKLPLLPAILTPGVFRAPGAPRKGRWPDEVSVYRALVHCSQGSRQLLGHALAGRQHQAPQVVADIAILTRMGQDPKPQFRWLSIQAVKEKKQLLAIASDLSDQTPETLKDVRFTVAADVAAVVLELERLKSTRMSRDNCFITALSAAIRMGGYDEDDSDAPCSWSCHGVESFPTGTALTLRRLCGVRASVLNDAPAAKTRDKGIPGDFDRQVCSVREVSQLVQLAFTKYPNLSERGQRPVRSDDEPDKIVDVSYCFYHGDREPYTAVIGEFKRPGVIKPEEWVVGASQGSTTKRLGRELRA